MRIFIDSRYARTTSGVALILVLGAVAMISMLVVAFLFLARTEQRSATAFSDTIDARNLTELPVNLAVAQIRRATEQNGATKTWASQPGMIRVFGTEPDPDAEKVRSKTVALYKLYSDDEMVITNSGATAKTNGLRNSEVIARLQADSGDLVDWQGIPGMYVDMNEPAAVVTAESQNVKIEFPIADPRAVFPKSGGLPVEGFNFRGNTQGGETMSGAPLSGTVAPTSMDHAGARLPMPVKWLYLLKDGSLVVATGGDAETGLRFDGEIKPSVANPITGRIAFWTDDESTKVNINTASEGIPWDMPRAYSNRDAAFARRQPAQNEFSRYPGHPAQTSLSPVFQAFGEPWNLELTMSDAEIAARTERYHKISPRTPWGGSLGGTVAPTGPISLVDGSGRPIKNDRLYATLDELVFDRNREPQDPALDARDLEIGRFFLTAHSRAPELNLFNKPRILLWPTSVSGSQRNAMDKLLLFLGKGGGRTWIIQRYQNYGGLNSPGSSQSVNADLYLGENLLNPGQTTTNKVGRNADMYTSYLKALTGNIAPTATGGSEAYDVPGFTGNLKTKYTPVRRDQILTQMFDFLRWSVNSYSSGMDPKYYYLPQRSGNLQGESSAVPLIPGRAGTGSVTLSTKGFGRFPTITEATIVFVATQNNGEDKYGAKQHTYDGDPEERRNGPDGYLDTTHMRAFIILEPYSPTVGMPSWTPNVRYKIEGLENFAVKGDAISSAQFVNMGFPAEAVNRSSVPGGWVDGGHATAYNGLGSQFIKADLNSTQAAAEDGAKEVSGGNENTDFPFISAEIPVKVEGADRQTFDFSGGDITIWVQTGYGNQGDAVNVQKLTLNFPPATLLVPKLKSGDAEIGNNGWGLKDIRRRFIKEITRTDGGKLHQTRKLIVNGDVTRSVELDVNGPTKGDLRILAATEDVPKSWFGVHPKYSNTNVMRLHFLRQGNQTYAGQYGPSERYLRAPNDTMGDYDPDEANTVGIGHDKNRSSTINTSGSLVKGLYYYRDCQPAVTRGLDGAMMYENGNASATRPGDWDNGTGRIEDGPYINKADEGNAATNNQADDSALGYFSRGSFTVESGVTYSPNRQIASAVAFGSLPSGIYGSRPAGASEFAELNNSTQKPRPWQTLLFCPNPAGRSTPALQQPLAVDHEGFADGTKSTPSPPDHLWLDLFWMPVVEPYAISEAFSTAGKINMNYAMQPFDHIERSTGIHAALKSTMITAISPNSAGRTTTSGYSTGGGENYKEGTRHKYELRYLVNTAATLKGFTHRFGVGDIFRSASEICEIFLVPERISGVSYNSDAKPVPTDYEDMVQWWNGNLNAVDAFEATGDNSREAPYNQLYPRLTTKSNTFTVHYRVQMLQKARSTDAATWLEGRDAVLSEHRGSATLERYMDPNDKELTAIMVGHGDFFRSWDQHYRFRVVERKQFAP